MWDIPILWNVSDNSFSLEDIDAIESRIVFSDKDHPSLHLSSEAFINHQDQVRTLKWSLDSKLIDKLKERIWDIVHIHRNIYVLIDLKYTQKSERESSSYEKIEELVFSFWELDGEKFSCINSDNIKVSLLSNDINEEKFKRYLFEGLRGVSLEWESIEDEWESEVIGSILDTTVADIRDLTDPYPTLADKNRARWWWRI